MDIRLAFPNEVDDIMAVIDEARAYIASYGSDQWQNGYPRSEDIMEDILQGQGYVAVQEGEIAAYAAVIKEHDVAYDQIYEGHWQYDNDQYVTFHRLATSSRFRGQKIMQTFLEGLLEGVNNYDFRCDTHAKNKPMQHVLEKLGFVYCGKVMLTSGERLAYQKIVSHRQLTYDKDVPEALKDGL